MPLLFSYSARHPVFSRSSIAFRFRQAFENARVTVLSSAGISPVSPRIHRLVQFLSCLARKMPYSPARLESSSFKVSSTIRSGGKSFALVYCRSHCCFCRCRVGFYSCGHRFHWDCQGSLFPVRSAVSCGRSRTRLPAPLSSLANRI
jgi:hypothetical protein